MSNLLDANTLSDLVESAVQAELWESDKRRLLFFRIADLRGKVPRAGGDELQLRTDLLFLNPSAPRDGVHPLLIWLQNARNLVAGLDQQEFFEKLLARLEGHPAEPVISPTVIEAVKKEVILFQDDMLPIGYLQAGLVAARSVARLRGPRYQTGVGQDKRYRGTGWMLTESLLITNHHVFNARDDGEPDASQKDFRDQALHTEVQFDVDSSGGGTNPASPSEATGTLTTRLPASPPCQNGPRSLWIGLRLFSSQRKSLP